MTLRCIFNIVWKLWQHASYIGAYLSLVLLRLYKYFANFSVPRKYGVKISKMAEFFWEVFQNLSNTAIGNSEPEFRTINPV
jgi:hypothetical protein